MKRNSIVARLSCTVFIAAPAAAQSPAPVAHASQPAVSPDGHKIAFLSSHAGADALYVMNVDGSQVRRISGNEKVDRPFWTNDSRHVLTTQRGGDTVVVLAFPADSGAPTIVAQLAARGGPVPFPDGERYVYGVGDWRVMQLESARRDGTDRKQITNAPAAHWCPSVSPSGDQVVVGRRDSVSWQVWIASSDGSGGHSVVRFPLPTGSTECPRWSPDGRRIAFQSGTRSSVDSTRMTAHIWVVDSAGRAPVKLAPHAQPWLDETPAWFPNGKRIVFQSNRTGRWEVWVMNADGTHQRQLTK